MHRIVLLRGISFSTVNWSEISPFLLKFIATIISLSTTGEISVFRKPTKIGRACRDEMKTYLQPTPGLATGVPLTGLCHSLPWCHFERLHHIWQLHQMTSHLKLERLCHYLQSVSLLFSSTSMLQNRLSGQKMLISLSSLLLHALKDFIHGTHSASKNIGCSGITCGGVICGGFGTSGAIKWCHQPNIKKHNFYKSRSLLKPLMPNCS